MFRDSRFGILGLGCGILVMFGWMVIECRVLRFWVGM